MLLKRLADADRDGDHVYAVVIGNAINNDGAGKVGFTAPSVEGQATAIAAALAVAGVDPRTISYVEAHGTGDLDGRPDRGHRADQCLRPRHRPTGAGAASAR